MLKILKNIFSPSHDKLSASSLSCRIEKDGWVLINHYSGELLGLAEAICSNSQLKISFHNTQKIIPKDKNEVEHFSLSSAYGLNRFPLHTDGAEYIIPPKYLVLRALSDSPTGTTIADAKAIKNNISVCESIWTVKTKDGIISTKLLETYNKYNRDYIRFNRLSMKCENGNKSEVYNAIDSLPINCINWTKNKTIIIDNWRMLHGRQIIIEKDYGKRCIERLQVFI